MKTKLDDFLKMKKKINEYHDYGEDNYISGVYDYDDNDKKYELSEDEFVELFNRANFGPHTTSGFNDSGLRMMYRVLNDIASDTGKPIAFNIEKFCNMFKEYDDYVYIYDNEQYIADKVDEKLKKDGKKWDNLYDDEKDEIVEQVLGHYTNYYECDDGSILAEDF